MDRCCEIAMDREEEEEEEEEVAKKILELRMNAKYDAGLIHRAIQQLIEVKKKKRAQTNKASSSSSSVDCFVEDYDGDDRRLLSRLLSQLESLKEDTAIEPPKPTSEMDVLSAVTKEEAKEENVGRPECGSKEIGQEEILRELRKVKRQNSITHWLLSFMIVLTAAWQISEVSLIMSVKNKFSNPFKSVGSAVRGMLTGKGKDETNESTNLLQIETPSLPSLKVPELPRIDLPALGLNNDDD